MSTDSPMLPSSNSHISQQSSEHHQLSSEMRSLHDLRELLPVGTDANEERDGEEQLEIGEGEQQEREVMVKVVEQGKQIMQLTQQLYYFKTQFFRTTQKHNDLTTALSLQKQTNHNLQLQLTHLKQTLSSELQITKQLRQSIEQKQSEILSLQKQIKQLKIQSSQKRDDGREMERWEKEIWERERVIEELGRRNMQIMGINCILKRELEVAQNKMVAMQLQMQDRTCGILLGHVQRLKQNQDILNNKDIYLKPWQSQNRNNTKETAHISSLTHQNKISNHPTLPQQTLHSHLPSSSSKERVHSISPHNYERNNIQQIRPLLKFKTSAYDSKRQKQ